MSDTATQQALAQAFQALHVPGSPLVLFNAWDVGSARAVADAGAKAIATGSWSVAAAHGYEDGERLKCTCQGDRRLLLPVRGGALLAGPAGPLTSNPLVARVQRVRC